MSISSNQVALVLNQLPGFGYKTALKVLEHYQDNFVCGGALLESRKDLMIYLKDLRLKKLLPRMPKSLEDLNFAQMQSVCQYCDLIMDKSSSLSIGLLNYFDSSYPETLRLTIDEKGEPSAPLVLFYHGNVEALHQPACAIVGTREPTVSGVSSAHLVASELARRGILIASNLSLGCDTAAYEGALSVGGATVAFMAHGLDSIFPPQNEGLVRRIVESGGVIVSEYPVGKNYDATAFIDRDRLTAAISQAGIVVQTKVDGAALHVTRSIVKAGKPLFALSFEDEEALSSPMYAGNLKLVEEDGARLLPPSNQAMLEMMVAQIKVDFEKEQSKRLEEKARLDAVNKALEAMKPVKRKRRTKAEMMAFRAEQEALKAQKEQRAVKGQGEEQALSAALERSNSLDVEMTAYA